MSGYGDADGLQGGCMAWYGITLFSSSSAAASPVCILSVCILSAAWTVGGAGWGDWMMDGWGVVDMAGLS